MSFGISLRNARGRGRANRSRAPERKLHLGLELLERRCLLSAGAQGISPSGMQEGAGVPPAPTMFVAPPVNMAANTAAPAVGSAASLTSDPPGSLSGIVFLEPTAGSPNFNPTNPAAGESPLPGVTVTLSGPGGTQSTVTDKTGAYSFSDLTPGVYSLTVTPPTGDTGDVAIASGSNGTASIGTISSITIGSGQNLTNENFAVTTGTQLEQVFFTASALVSGVQIPIAPFEQLIAAAPKPVLSQQIPGPVFVAPLPGMTIPAGAPRPIRLGGSGGDTVVGGNSVYADDALDQVWSPFGNRDTDNWLNEGPEQAILERLSTLSNMDLLNAGGTQVFRADGPDSNDRRDDLFDFNDRFDGRGIDDYDILPDVAPLESSTQTVGRGHAEQAVLLDPVVQTQGAVCRLASEADESPSASVGLVAGWMLATGTRRAASRDRVGYFERRRRA